MIDHPVVKAIGTLSAVVGLLTGIGTVVAWLESDSLWEPLVGAIRIAGVVYLGASCVGCVVALVMGGRSYWALRAIGVLFLAWSGFAVAYYGGWKGEDRWFFFAWGCLGLAIAAVATVSWVVQTVRSYRLSHMTCPDCAENVKSEARVCHYCGYRFKPAPFATGEEPQTPGTTASVARNHMS